MSWVVLHQRASPPVQGWLGRTGRTGSNVSWGQGRHRQEPWVPAGRGAGPAPPAKTRSMVLCAGAQQQVHAHLLLAAGMAIQWWADGAGGTLPVTTACTAHRGTAPSTEGRFCSISRGQLPAEPRRELEGSSSSTSMTLLPCCDPWLAFLLFLALAELGCGRGVGTFLPSHPRCPCSLCKECALGMSSPPSPRLHVRAVPVRKGQRQARNRLERSMFSPIAQLIMRSFSSFRA